MPAVSKKQRRAAAIAKLIKKGKMKATPGTASAQMAQMPMSSLDEFASTPEGNLPLSKIGGNVPGRPGGGRRSMLKDTLRRVGGSKRNIRSRV